MLAKYEWDKYEIAYLLDNCIKIEKGILSKEETISQMSEHLRKRGKLRGMDITDDFRSKVVVERQLRAMGEAFFGKWGGCIVPPNFFDIVDLYKNDREAFDELLHSWTETPEPEEPEVEEPKYDDTESEFTIEDDEDEESEYDDTEPEEPEPEKPSVWDVKKTFLAWLAKRETAALSSDPRSSIQQTMDALNLISERCRKIRLTRTDLFGIIDRKEIYRLTEKIVLTPVIINISSKGEAYKLYIAMETYYSFLASEPFKPNPVPRPEPREPVTEAMLFAFLNDHGIRYIDKRRRGGGLWIKGGRELNNLVKYCCTKFGINFTYNRGNARVLRGTPGWWTRDYVKSVYIRRN